MVLSILIAIETNVSYQEFNHFKILDSDILIFVPD